MQSVPQDLLKEYVQSQHFTSTTEIMAAMKEMFRDVIQTVMEVEMDEELGRERCERSDEPVYQFLDKKRAEGKPYFVYMTAAQNKFLRIYYARVKECLEAFDAKQNTSQG